MSGRGPGPVAPRTAVSLDRLADGAADGLVGVDQDLTIVQANETFCRALGRTRSDLAGTPFADQFVEREQAAKGVRLAFDLGVLTDYELTLRADGGRRVPVSLNAAALHQPGAVARTVVVSVRDGTDRRELERQLGERVRELLRRVTAAQDEERARIARDIHDDTIQLLAALSLRLVRLRSRLAEPAVLELAAQAEQWVELAAGRLRRLVFELRPPELDLEQGLVTVLREHLDSAGDDVALAGEVTGSAPEGLAPEARLVVYRIAMEALINVRKHACASHVQVEVATLDRGCLVRVRDDGRGFDPGRLETVPGHLGVTAMRERAEMAGGWWRCESSPGAGTVVEFWVPG
jgi:PAS domain S-box-containing protein